MITVQNISALAVLPLLILAIGCDDGGDARRVHADVGYGADVGDDGLGCQGAEGCRAEELCVADGANPSHGRCVAQCSIEDGDVCPVGERCANVIDARGERAAACVPGEVPSQGTWQRCDSRDACGGNEDCLYLDDVLGARCVPSCNPDGSCERAGDECALHWEGSNGAESGCVRSCTTNSECAAGWRCEQGASVAGLCVR